MKHGIKCFSYETQCFEWWKRLIRQPIQKKYISAKYKATDKNAPQLTTDH